MLKEIGEREKWKDVPCAWVGKLNTVKILILLKVFYRFHAIPSKTTVIFFAGIEKSILKFIWNLKGTPKAKITLKRNKGWVSYFLISSASTSGSFSRLG